MKLSLGPIPWFWARDRVFDFYRAVADSPADIVCLGEVVCAKRRELTTEDWFAIARALRAAGKDVVLSTLTLVEAASEAAQVRRLCENGEFPVEANDFTAIRYLTAARAAFSTGPSVNIYNHRSLALLARQGLRRWVLPVELGLDALAELQARRPNGVETEVFAFGRLPLAWSARCFTARSDDLPKDDCRFRCLDYPDGRLLRTREDEAFLVLNGIQTLSARTHQALDAFDELAERGVDVLRISPQAEVTLAVLGLFDEARNGGDRAALAARLDALLPGGACSGYLHDRAGMDHGHSHAA
ncbi:MAG: U32 family peptidase [Xanthomonadales bacterium]